MKPEECRKYRVGAGVVVTPPSVVVHCDALWRRGGEAAIAAVLAHRGKPVESHAKIVSAKNSHYAEVAAIEFARSLYDVVPHNDSISACAQTGAKWIRRKFNTLAHNAAKACYRQHKIERVAGIFAEIMEVEISQQKPVVTSWLCHAPSYPDPWKFGSIWGDY